MATSSTTATWSLVENSTDNSVTSVGGTNTTGSRMTTPNWLYLVPTDDSNVFDYMSPKDQTLFVSLIIMGVVVPAIFIFMFFMICWRRYKEQKERREQTLLRHSQDVPMDDIPYAMMARLERGVL